jgi:hypothetical protein
MDFEKLQCASSNTINLLNPQITKNSFEKSEFCVLIYKKIIRVKPVNKLPSITVVLKVREEQCQK